MGYVDEVIELVVKKNPAEAEFHQAVKEVLESLRVVVDANEEKFRREGLLERLVEPDRQIKFREDLYLVEEIERFETGEHVALQAQAKRHHGHDHRYTDDDAHGRQHRAQLRLA
jgi:hypothetical protein